MLHHNHKSPEACSVPFPSSFPFFAAHGSDHVAVNKNAAFISAATKLSQVMGARPCAAASASGRPSGGGGGGLDLHRGGAEGHGDGLMRFASWTSTGQLPVSRIMRRL